MNTFLVANLPKDKFFESDAILDKRFVLCPVGVPISDELRSALMDWGFDNVFADGGITDNSPLFARNSRMGGGPAGDELSWQADGAANGVGGASADASSSGEAKKPIMAFYDKELEAVRVTYEAYLKYAESFYEKFTLNQSINVSEVNNKIKDFCLFVRKNRRLVLRLQSEDFKTGAKNYLGEHALRSTVFAEAIAIQLNFPVHRIIELGVSCFLHEIGMTRLPQKILDSTQSLTAQERKAVAVHPVLSYNIMREAEFPLNICLGALEHHERENGKGYPRHLTKDHITIYAKIIAVACSYEAATSKRTFKEGLDAYSGIIDILKNNDQQYNPKIAQALLLSLSLYPIGLYVLLSDGRRGQVVDINPEDPKYPVVQLLGEYKANGTAKTLDTSEFGVYILRPLTKDETAALRG